MKRSRLPALGALLVLGGALTPSASSAAPWSYTLGAGFASPYALTSNDYSDAFGATWTAAGAAMHPINTRLSLRLSAGWTRHDRNAALALIPEDPPPQLEQRVSIVPLGAGVRWNVAAEPARGPFLDLAPVLVYSRWYEHFRQVGQDLNGNVIRRDETAARSKLGAGVELGFAVNVATARTVHPEFSVHYLAATGPDGSAIPSLEGRPVHGVQQLSVVVSAAWTK